MILTSTDRCPTEYDLMNLIFCFLSSYQKTLNPLRLAIWILLTFNGQVLWSQESTLTDRTQDTTDSDFPTPFNTETSNLEPMPATEAAATFQCLPGFSVSLVAAEPDVQNPIAMTWDERGRLWVAENYTYSDLSQRFDLSLRDRVLIFDDFDENGRANRRKVFTDKVQMLTSVEVGRGGVWLMCPPELLFIPDTDQDDIPDGDPIVVLDGFHVAHDNYHNFANGLKWGPDGWLYGRCGHACPGNVGKPGTPDDQRVPIVGGMWRYHPERQTFEVLCHGTVNPWGHDWDRHGELFYINVVIGHLWHATPGSHFKESWGESINPFVYQRMDTIADHYHFDVGQNWMESRDGKANDYGGGHAHSGMIIYQGQQWPQQYQDQLFTLNFHGRRINVDRLERTTAGYVGRHQPDFALSADPFFRGIDLTFGPDGQVYLIDWSDIGECHEHTGVHRTSGRIFKIQYDSPATATTTERPFTKPACLAGDGKLQNLWRDYQAGRTTTEQLRQFTEDSDEHLRVWAIRLLSDHWPLDWITGPGPQTLLTCDSETLQRLIRMAHEDPSGLVIRQLTSTLQRLPVKDRYALAKPLLARQAFGEQEDLALLAWYGLIPVGQSSPEQLIELATSSRWPRVNRWIARMIASRHARSMEYFETLLQRAGEMTGEAQLETLVGISEAYQGLRRAEKPEQWENFVALPALAAEQVRIRELEVLFGDGKALDQVRDIALDPNADFPARQTALETLIQARPDDLMDVCKRLLGERGLNTVALRGLALFEDPQIAKLLLERYHRFLPNDQARVIDNLISRRDSAATLLETMAQQPTRIPPSDLSASQARQIKSHADPKLDELLSNVWGELRESDADRRQLIQEWTEILTPETLALADLSNGRRLYDKTCGSCHKLFGEGEHIGPDLTGAQRSSLEYLLENILDPSAVVSKEYRMSIVMLEDGRVINGLVMSRKEGKLMLRTATEMLTIVDEEIEDIRESNLSAMPDGLLQGLTEEEVRDLIGYLMSPEQVAPPAEQSEIIPLPRAHAHNDYYHRRPLFDAIERGFTSVEADVFLVKGLLLVGHYQWELRSERTLESLYLKPLSEWVAANGGHVFPKHPDQILWLHIDVKTEARSTFAAIQEQLKSYQHLFQKKETDQGATTPGPAVRVLISGSRDYQQIANAHPRLAGIDGRLNDLDSELSPEIMPLLSDSWKNHFQWSGRGEMPAHERETLNRFVKETHASGRKLRLWATPENRAVWRELDRAQVDFINTDQLDKLKNFFLTQESPSDQ